MGILCARCHALVEVGDDDGDLAVCEACRANEWDVLDAPKPSQKKPAFWMKDEELAGHERKSPEPYVVQAPAEHDSSIHDLASLMRESSASTNPSGRNIDADLLQLPSPSFVTAPPEPEEAAEEAPRRPSADEEVWFAAGDMTPIDDDLAASQPPPPRPPGEVPSVAPSAGPSVAPLLDAEPPRSAARPGIIVRSYLPKKVGPWAGAAAVALLGLVWLAVRAAPTAPSDAATAPSAVQPEATAVAQAAAPAPPAPAAEPTPAPEPAAPQAAQAAPEPAPPANDSATEPAAQAQGAAGKVTQPASAPQPGAAGRKAFNRAAANAALSSAASRATACRKAGDPKGLARVTVTFAPTGRASQVQVAPPFSGTKSGACVAGVFRTVSVPAFDGQPIPAAKGVSLR